MVEMLAFVGNVNRQQRQPKAQKLIECKVTETRQNTNCLWHATSFHLYVYGIVCLLLKHCVTN